MRRNGYKGDLLVTVEVQVPDELTDEARAAMEAYRDSRGTTDPRSSMFPAGG
jgi:molecular chaperone DnaJ